jgi:hypothetical protein
MCNSLEAYRSAIDMLYNCSRISIKCMLVQADSYVQVSIKQIYNIEENGDEQ